MSAIWHEPNTPSWIAAGPEFSFYDVAEIVAPAPESYVEARKLLQAWERKFGAAWYQDNAQRSWVVWQAKRPWWLV